MYRIAGDLHTHTVHSHGTGTVEQNVLAAIEKGLDKIAISDHGFLHLAYRIRDIDAYIADIRGVREKYRDRIDVLVGAELNLLSLDGDIDLPAGYEDAFDILTFGYHKLVKYKGFKNIRQLLLPKSHSQKAIEANTRAYIRAMEKNKVDVISHPGYGLPIDKREVAKYAQQYGVALEINAKHPEFTVDELKACAETGV
ncbi:MAG: PHP domain-containing protein, partial [Christensenellaceae bacterium]